MWLKWHMDNAIAHQAYWPPPGSIWVHCLNHQRVGGKLIRISMITTAKRWRLAVYSGYRSSPTGGTKKRKHTHSTPISQMLYTTYSLSYQIVSEWWPVFPMGRMVLAGISQKPQARPFKQKSLYSGFLESITAYLEVMTQHWIQLTQKTTLKWSERRRKEHCTEWPWSTTFWRCVRTAIINVLHSRNFALNTGKCLPFDTFQTQKRSSKHPGHSFNMIVWLILNCQKDHLCHQLCLQGTSFEHALKYQMCAESEASTVIQSKVMRIAHLKAFPTPKICLIGMATLIIQMTAMTIAPQTWNLI